MAQNNQGGSQGRGREQGDTSKRGFASMDDEKQRAIAAEGGRAAHQQGTAHEFDSEEAREAGRKGGQSRSQSSDSDRDMEGSDRGGNRGQQAQDRERDSQGQFTSREDASSDRESGRGASGLDSDSDDRGGRTR